MSKGGSNKKQTTTSTSEPWKEAQPTLKTVLANANNVAKNSANFQPYQGSTVVPYAGATTQGMNRILNVTEDQSGLDNAYNSIAGLANSNGYNAEQSDALSQLRSLMSGGYDFKTSPAFDQVLKRTQNDAANAVNMSASAAGRYGSGIAQGNVAREVGDVTANALSNQYNQDYQNRLASIGQMFNAGQQGITNRFSAASALPTLFDARLDPARAQMGIGSMQEDLAGRQLNDQIRLYEGNRDAPKNATEWLNAIATGSGSLGQSGTSTASTPKTNPFAATLGGAASGFGAGGPIGALLGGGAGLLGSIF